MGETFWDTGQFYLISVLTEDMRFSLLVADRYGDSEELLGKWFAANPETLKDIFLATKFGFAPAAPGTAGTHGARVDTSPEYCR